MFLYLIITGNKERKKNSKFSEFLRHRRKNRIKRDDAFLPEQFEIRKKTVPWKAIGYAIGLFVIGTALLIAGCLIHTGHVDNEVRFELIFLRRFEIIKICPKRELIIMILLL